MRSLIIRFLDSEGPGTIENSLKNSGYKITYHDTYKKGLQLIPESQQIFDLVILMGGPQTVYDPKQESFFKPYFDLVEELLLIPNKRVLGICLGSQIIAKVLGAKVYKGEKGSEIGFSNIKIKDKSHPIFSSISKEEIPSFHLHDDTFDLPLGAKLLASSDSYENQIFDYEKKAIGIQCHFEVTAGMLKTWWNVHKSIPSKLGDFDSKFESLANQMNQETQTIFDTIIKGY
jgi:GMP synthase-like glutamine amidotransferase